MKITPWYLAALAPFAAMGCSGAYLGHAAVVLLTLGIFLGTLALGRTTGVCQAPPIPVSVFVMVYAVALEPAGGPPAPKPDFTIPRMPVLSPCTVA